MHENRLLALDFRGTLDVMATWCAADKQHLITLLRAFQQANFKIIFVSNEEEQVLKAFCCHYRLDSMIACYKCPVQNSLAVNDIQQINTILQQAALVVFPEKVLQLTYYANYFSVNKNNIYFFDDSYEHTNAAMVMGFLNTKWVSANKSLLQYLIKLAKQFNLTVANNYEEIADSQNTRVSMAKNRLAILGCKKVFRFIKNCATRPVCN